MELHIHHIVVIWDECEHISSKHSKEISNVFNKHYVNAFPEGAKTDESPMVVTTKSQIISEMQMSTFLHNGKFIPYSGKNKDLAILKFCTSGVVDQNDNFHYILDDMRSLRDKNNDKPLRSDTSCIVVFITSDWAKGMLEALDHVYDSSTRIRSSFISYRVPKLSGKNHERIAYAGNAVGIELKKRYVKNKDGGLIFNMEN